MEKISLYQSLMRENRIKAAYLVARNEFYRKPGHSSNFEQYLEFCLTVGSHPVELETRGFFINEAEKALGHYADHVVMTEKVLKEIVTYRQKLVDARDSLERELQVEKVEERKRIIAENKQVLKELEQLKQVLETTNEQIKVNELVETIRDTENKMRKKELTQNQQEFYQNLQKELSNIISDNVKETRSKENKAYNEQALASYKAVLTAFQQKKGNGEAFLEILKESQFFSYDRSQLFEETVQYYQFVYSYLFDHLEEEGKYQLTKQAISKE